MTISCCVLSTCFDCSLRMCSYLSKPIFMTVDQTQQALEKTTSLVEVEIGGTLVRIEDLAAALQGLEPEKFLLAVQSIVRGGASAALKLLVDGIEIQMTQSAFLDPDSKAILEQTASAYPFSRWLSEMQRPLTAATREDMMDWWDTFMTMSGIMGISAGKIDVIGQGQTNLWKATGALAADMTANPASFRFLPPLLANHPHEVRRVLGEISDPRPWVSVLVGERFDDMTEPFLSGFSTVTSKENPGEISRTTRDAVLSIFLALQRSSRRKD